MGIKICDMAAHNSSDRKWYLSRIRDDRCMFVQFDKDGLFEYPKPFNQDCFTTLELITAIFTFLAYLTAVLIFFGFCFGLDSKKTSLKEKDEKEKKAQDCELHYADEEMETLTMSPQVYTSDKENIEELNTDENGGQRRKSVPKIVQEFEEKSKMAEENSAQPSIKRRLPEGSLTARSKFKAS